MKLGTRTLRHIRHTLVVLGMIAIPGCGWLLHQIKPYKDLCERCQDLPTILERSACQIRNCFPQSTPTPGASATATSTSTPTATPTESAAPRATSEPMPPTLNGITGEDPITHASGRVEITQRYISTTVATDVLDEIPWPAGHEEWRNCRKGKCGQTSCDRDHWFFEGRRTIMWWVCGGSIKEGREPRHWDETRPFDVTGINGVHVEYPCFRKDNFNFCVYGSGMVSVCALPDVRTCLDPTDRDPECPSGVVYLKIRKRCVTRRVAVDVRKPTSTTEGGL